MSSEQLILLCDQLRDVVVSFKQLPTLLREMTDQTLIMSAFKTFYRALPGSSMTQQNTVTLLSDLFSYARGSRPVSDDTARSCDVRGGLEMRPSLLLLLPFTNSDI